MCKLAGGRKRVLAEAAVKTQPQVLCVKSLNLARQKKGTQVRPVLSEAINQSAQGTSA